MTDPLVILDVIDGIVDDTHPEGDGCPLCVALDDLRDSVVERLDRPGNRADGVRATTNRPSHGDTPMTTTPDPLREAATEFIAAQDADTGDPSADAERIWRAADALRDILAIVEETSGSLPSLDRAAVERIALAALATPALDDDLRELRRLSEAATAGPWIVTPDDGSHGAEIATVEDGIGVVRPDDDSPIEPSEPEMDAAFIAAAANYVRARLTEDPR